MSETHKRLAAVAGRMPSLGKDKKNREQGFAFRSIEKIVAEARPLLADEGLSIVPTRILSHISEEVTAKSGARGYRTIVEVEYSVGCEDDNIIGAGVGEAIDYGDKSTSKATQMAFKYFLTDVLLVAEGDPDETTPEARGSGKPNALVRLKNELVAEYGTESAAAAWRVLFPDGDPTVKSITAKRAEEISIAIAGIVEDGAVPEQPSS